MFRDIKETVLDIIKAVSPIILAVIILQFAVIKMPISQFIQFLIGGCFVMVGMTFFLLGVKVGLLPMGEAMGSGLPRLNSIFLIIAIAFLIGFAVTIAEPDVIVLSNQVDLVSQGEISKHLLISVIGIGVGVFVVLAIIRIVYGIRIAYLLAAGYAIVLALSFFVPAEFVPVAFDAGGVTTGPMTVPVILALGIGFSSILAGKSALSDGFGLIGLASIGPIIGVMLMGIVLK